MWQLLERKISFLCLFVYFWFFCHPHFSVFFFFLLFLLSAFFFHPHFSIRIFPSASAIRRYPVRVLQTPELHATNWYSTMKSNNFIIPLYCCDSKSNFCAGFFFALKWNKLQWAEYLVESMTCNICLWCQYASLVSICMCGKCNGCAFINECNKTNSFLKKPSAQPCFMWTVCNVKGTQTVVLSSTSYET